MEAYLNGVGDGAEDAAMARPRRPSGSQRLVLSLTGSVKWPWRPSAH
jgi:hypothetical protein